MEQKLEKSKEVLRKLGKDRQYIEELGKVSRECFRVERKVIKLISKYNIGNENVENAREICKL